MKKARALVVDDDSHILRLMQRILQLEGDGVLIAAGGEDALNLFAEEAPDLVLLDVKMPGMDGYTVCRRIREFSQVPIIMVTAKEQENEKLKGFECGADDYITKPFSHKELLARVKAVLQRSRFWDERPEPTFRYQDLAVDFAQNKVTLGGRETNLTANEYRLLSYLARHAGQIVTPNQLLEKVWGETYAGSTHVLRVTLARLRRKLHDSPRNPRYIFTRQGIGYMLARENEAAQPPSHHSLAN